MSTGTEIIQKALQTIGVFSVATPNAPENIVVGMDILNSMGQEWADDDIDLEIFPLGAAGDELGEPLSVKNGLVFNLAIYLAPYFDNGKVVISQTLRDNARKTYKRIRDNYASYTIPDKTLSSTTPQGAGNSRGRFNERFVGSGGTVPSSDG